MFDGVAFREDEEGVRSVGDEPEVVADQDEGEGPSGAEFVEEVPHGFGGLRVEDGGHFVADEDDGFGCQGAGDVRRAVRGGCGRGG
ncbi:hypothetical protein AB0M64_03845 [Streptomyces sp. NPDC051771]|uniref:hypothetical protein n=1 Tax=Streptomyces sp. NPDC051771 TaxID=3154847 RepID=UPI003424E0F2